MLTELSMGCHVLARAMVAANVRELPLSGILPEVGDDKDMSWSFVKRAFRIPSTALWKDGPLPPHM